MLTEEQLEYIPEVLRPLFQYLEHEVIVDVARRIKETLAYTRTAEIEAQALQRLGYSPSRIRKEAMNLLNADAEFRKQVAKNTLKHKKEVKKCLQEIAKEAYKENDKLFSEIGDLSYLDDLRTWKSHGKELTDDSFLHDLVQGIERQTKGELKNLTRTTGFKTMAGFESIQDTYRRELDKALIKVCSGAYTKEQVIYDVVHDLSRSGLRTIDYASGRHKQLDTAVTLAVRTGAHQLAEQMTAANVAQSGENLIYVSRHWGARNTGTGHANHEEWQGKVYYIKPGEDYTEEAKRIGQSSIEDLWEVTGYSMDGTHPNDPFGLNGYNCRHKTYVFFKGISKISDIQKEEDEPKPVVIDGKVYDYYAMTQKMRSMERNIRALKREREALNTLGMDTKEIKVKIKQKTAEYENFCDKYGMKAKLNRLRYEHHSADVTKTQAYKEYQKQMKAVANSSVPVTIEETKYAKEESISVHSVGRINKEIYKCITEDIVTDEVIITDERIQHIKDRHPNDYERFCGYLKEIVEQPQYIVETKKPNTALILKEFTDGEEQFKTVLRLHTSCDNPDYKNSIITFMKIDEKEWKRLLKNKAILYKAD